MPSMLSRNSERVSGGLVPSIGRPSPPERRDCFNERGHDERTHPDIYARPDM